jgi:hypothetical protein
MLKGYIDCFVRLRHITNLRSRFFVFFLYELVVNLILGKNREISFGNGVVPGVIRFCRKHYFSEDFFNLVFENMSFFSHIILCHKKLFRNFGTLA